MSPYYCSFYTEESSQIDKNEDESVSTTKSEESTTGVSKDTPSDETSNKESNNTSGGMASILQGLIIQSKCI